MDKNSAGISLCIYYTHLILTHCLCVLMCPKCVLVNVRPHVSCFANRRGICFLFVCVYSSANREFVFVFLSTVRLCVCVRACVCVCLCMCEQGCN